MHSLEGMAQILDLMLSGWGAPWVFRNGGSGFTEMSAALGLSADRQYRDVAFGDYDNDGDLDFVMPSTRYTPGCLVARNNAGTSFTDVTSAVGMASCMGDESTGAAFGDFDNDGDLDIYISNTRDIEWSRGDPQDHLYRFDGTSYAAVDPPTWGLAESDYSRYPAFVDYDSDGDFDIILAVEAYGTTLYPAKVYRNDGTAFAEVASTLGVDGPAWSVHGDYDQDGDVDLVANDGLLRNDCPPRSYIDILPRVAAATGHRAAVGARVYVDLDGSGDFVFPGTLMQEVTDGQNGFWRHFGLGGRLNDVAVKVVYPGPGTLASRTVVYNDVRINRRVVLDR